MTSCENFLSGAAIKQEIEEQIEYANAPECTFILKSDESRGTFLSSGEKKCKVGYTMDLQFTVTTEDYIFMGLDAVSSTDNVSDRSECIEFTINNQEEAEVSGVYKITLKLLKKANDLLIRPKFEKLANGDIEITNVNVEGIHGTFTPAKGVYNLIMGRSYEIAFDPDSDYEFIRWEIFDKNSGEKINDGTYLDFEDISSKKASFIFKGVPENQDIKICVRPIIAERPQILSYSPLFEAEGVNKDTAIQIVFDHDMDDSSIYYTEEEIRSLKDSGIADSDFLPEISDELPLQNHYGYKKNGEVFYKNVLISDSETGVNRNDCFNPPVFDSKRILIISASKTKYLPSYSIPLVTLDKNFCCSVDGKKVSMAGSKKWIYQVNKDTDGDEPVIQEGSEPEIYIHPTLIETSDGESEIQGKRISAGACPESIWTGDLFNNENKLGLNLNVKDNGIGPSNMFTMKFQKVLDGSYGDVGEVEVYEKTVYYQYVRSKVATYNNIVDISDLNLTSGVYALSFEFKDKSGNQKDYPESGKYHFAVDKTEPAVSNFKAEDSDGDTVANLFWTNAADIKQSKVEYKKQSDSEYTLSHTLDGENSCSVSGLVHGTDYDFRITTEDYNGNIATENTTYSSKPGPVRNLRLTDHTNMSITVEWDPPENGDCDGYTVTFSFSECSRYDFFSETFTLDKNVTYYTWLIPGTLYAYAMRLDASVTTNRGAKTNASPQNFTTGKDFSILLKKVENGKVQLFANLDSDYWNYKVYKWKDSTDGTDYIPQESDYYADMTATKFEDSESYYSFTTLSLGNTTIKVPSYGKRNYKVKAVNKNNPEIVCWSDTYRAPDVDAE